MKITLRLIAPLAAMASCIPHAALAQTGEDRADTTPATPPAVNVVEPTAADIESATAAPSRWRAELSTWIWLMGVDGDIGVRGRTINVNASFGDVVDASDSIFAFSGRLEVGYGAIGAYIDGMYSDIGIDDQSGPLGIASYDIGFQQTILDFGLMWRVAEWEPTGEAAANPRSYSVDLYAGGRFNNMNVSFDPLLTPRMSQDKDWVDPIVGAKLIAPIAETCHFAINADIGGFGAASDLTWSTTALIGYDFYIGSMPASVLFGYRAMGWDFSDGSGDREFVWQVVQHGLHFGFTLEF